MCLGRYIACCSDIGGRIEDVLYVNDKGELVNLSGDLPAKADEIEKLMSSAK